MATELLDEIQTRHAGGWTLMYWHRAWWWSGEGAIQPAYVDPRKVIALQCRGLLGVRHEVDGPSRYFVRGEEGTSGAGGGDVPGRE